MYISPIDILDISIAELEQIDEKNIIRLEKKLHVLKLQNQDNYFNVEEANLVLKQLKNEEDRKVILFIEKHPLFKTFITSGKANGSDTFKFQEENLNELENFSSFLDPYLKTYFVRLLKKDYQNKTFEASIEGLKHQSLFENETLLECHQFIEQQTKILIEKISVCKPKQLFDKHPEVTYESHINLLNVVPFGIIGQTKLAYAQAIISYFSRTHLFNSEYPKIRNAYSLLSKIEVEEALQKKVLDDYSNLGLGRLHAFKKKPKLVLINKFTLIPLKFIIFAPIKLLEILIITLKLVFQIGLLFPLGVISFTFGLLQLVVGSPDQTRKEVIHELKEQLLEVKKFFTTNPFTLK